MPDQPSQLTALPWQPPDRLFALCRGESRSVLLDSGGPADQARQRWSFLCPRPSAQLTLPAGSRTSIPATLRDFMAAHTPATPGCPPLPDGIPFDGGIIGMLSYEAGLTREGLASRHQPDCPALVALACRNLFIMDRQERKLWWASADGLPPPDLPVAPAPAAPSAPLFPVPEQDAATWQAAMERVRDYIAAGDIFQANLTMRWTAARPAGLALHQLYRELRTHCPAPFGAWLHTPDVTLLSASVERFLSLDRHGRIETRPIKGTCPVGTTPQEDERLRAALYRDEKERAENLMITDLMRHDIGRVCTLGSVAVPQLFAVERFAHVHHLVSSVTGRLRPGCDGADLLTATLPPGSVTGAPKYRAMEIIDELEPSARGAYCGTLFRLGRDGAMDSAVIIRSISATETHLRLGAGGGITHPSRSEREYEEMCLKAAPLLKVMKHHGR